MFVRNPENSTAQEEPFMHAIKTNITGEVVGGAAGKAREIPGWKGELGQKRLNTPQT